MAIEILVLTQADCAICDHASLILARLQETFDLEIKTLGINSEAGERLARAGGILFPPGIFVNGQAFSYGRLSQRKLRRHLAQAQESRVGIGEPSW